MSGPESNKPDDALLEDFLAGHGAVRETYRAAAQEQAPSHLDDSVLHVAQAAARQAPPARRARWYPPVAAAAVMVLSFGVFLQVQRDPVLQWQVSEQPAAAPASTAPGPEKPAESQDAAVAAATAMEQTDAAREEVEAVPRPKAFAAAAAKKTKPIEAQKHEDKRLEARAAATAAPPPAPPLDAMADAAPPPAALSAAEPERVESRSALQAESYAAPSVTGAMKQEADQPRTQSAAPIGKSARLPAQGNLVQQQDDAAAVASGDSAWAKSVTPLPMECSDVQPHQLAAVDSALSAVDAAMPALVRLFGAGHVARFEPFRAERQGRFWRVYGALPAGAAGGTPEAEVCAATGKVVTTRHTQ